MGRFLIKTNESLYYKPEQSSGDPHVALLLRMTPGVVISYNYESLF